MQRLEVRGAVRPLQGSLGVKGLNTPVHILSVMFVCYNLRLQFELYRVFQNTELDTCLQLSGPNYCSVYAGQRHIMTLGSELRVEESIN
jgi:hypothetical protein